MTAGAPPFYDNRNAITGEMVQQIIELMPALDETHRKILSFMALSGDKDGWQVQHSATLPITLASNRPQFVTGLKGPGVLPGWAEHHMVAV